MNTSQNLCAPRGGAYRHASPLAGEGPPLVV